VQSGFVGWNRWLENMVGANGKVGPNPGLVSIEYTKRWWNVQFKKRQTSCIVIQYRKPPTISPGLIYFRKRFLMGLYMDDLLC
jgi:hypothetical protein